MNITQLIHDRIRGLIGMTIETPNHIIERATVRTRLEELINAHQNVIDTMNMLDAEEAKQFHGLVTSAVASAPASMTTWLGIYKGFLARIHPAAKAMESNAAFSSLLETNRACIIMLTKIVDGAKLEELIPDERIGVQTLTITQTMLFGFIDMCEIIAECTTAMWAGVIEALLPIRPNPAKYTLERTSSALDDLAAFVDLSMSSENVVAFDKVMERYKRAGKDTTLITSDNQPNMFIRQSTGEPGANPLFIRGLTSLNPLVWVRQALTLMKSTRISKLETERQWLTTQIELLRLQMGGVDPDSVEYRRLVAIIQRYEATLAQHARTIEQYRKGG